MIKVDASGLQGPGLEKAVDEDIAAFDEFFRSIGNENLVPSEWAILKTYLWWKTKKEKTDAG